MRKKRKGPDDALFQLLFGEEAGELTSAPPSEPEAPKVTPIKVPKAKKSESKPVTVTELTRKIRGAIKDAFTGTIAVVGEISNLCAASSGHIYFTLKDSQSQISCAFWRSKANGLKFHLADGMAVVVHGEVDVYGPRGQYQLYVTKVSPYGLGELELAFRQLKEKLEKEGLFDSDHKKPIPGFPLTIAVVTSPTGAAIRDVLRTLEIRWPVGRVLVFPVQVQGEEAAPQIAAAIEELNRNARRLAVDVVLLVRGGGSLEDLWAFNEEVVARAIYRSKLPIVSGVGHEVDVTIADLVADHRAATPTAAAQAVTPVLTDVMDEIRDYYHRLRGVTTQTLTIERGRLRQLAGRGMFRHPVIILGSFVRQLDEEIQRLGNGMKRIARMSRNRAHESELRLGRISPNVLVAKAGNQVVKLQQSLKFAMSTLLTAQKARLARQATVLKEQSPRYRALKGAYNLSTLETTLKSFTAKFVEAKSLLLRSLEARVITCDYRNVLRRGFAVVRRAKDSKIVASIDMVSQNDQIVSEFADGKVTSNVDKVERQDGPTT